MNVICHIRVYPNLYLGNKSQLNGIGKLSIKSLSSSSSPNWQRPPNSKLSPSGDIS
jgi:hypothetical protein